MRTRVVIVVVLFVCLAGVTVPAASALEFGLYATATTQGPTPRASGFVSLRPQTPAGDYVLSFGLYNDLGGYCGDTRVVPEASVEFAVPLVNADLDTETACGRLQLHWKAPLTSPAGQAEEGIAVERPATMTGSMAGRGVIGGPGAIGLQAGPPRPTVDAGTYASVGNPDDIDSVGIVISPSGQGHRITFMLSTMLRPRCGGSFDLPAGRFTSIALISADLATTATVCGDITLHWEGTGEPVETADGFERPATLTGTIHYPGYFTAPINTVVWGPTSIGVLAPA